MLGLRLARRSSPSKYITIYYRDIFPTRTRSFRFNRAIFHILRENNTACSGSRSGDPLHMMPVSCKWRIIQIKGGGMVRPSARFIIYLIPLNRKWGFYFRSELTTMRSKELWIILLKSGCRLLKNLSLSLCHCHCIERSKNFSFDSSLRNITSLLIGRSLAVSSVVRSQSTLQRLL
jgi:hypothetical protein